VRQFAFGSNSEAGQQRNSAVSVTFWIDLDRILSADATTSDDDKPWNACFTKLG